MEKLCKKKIIKKYEGRGSGMLLGQGQAHKVQEAGIKQYIEIFDGNDSELEMF